MDSTLLFAAVVAAASYSYSCRMRRWNPKGGRRVGTKQRCRVRRSVESVRDEIGDDLFRRAYRMSFTSFQELHALLQPVITAIHKELMDKASAKRREERTRRLGTRRTGVACWRQWQRFVPNGVIHTTVRLAIALHFFAGGDIYDIAPLYGVGRTDTFRSVWMVVEAVLCTDAWKLVFPENHTEQKQLARAFANRSQAGFNCCVGAVDGILIWVLQPSPSCCKESSCNATKFFCGRKHKFSLNCQAVADCRGKFVGHVHPVPCIGFGLPCR